MLEQHIEAELAGLHRGHPESSPATQVFRNWEAASRKSMINLYHPPRHSARTFVACFKSSVSVRSHAAIELKCALAAAYTFVLQSLGATQHLSF